MWIKIDDSYFTHRKIVQLTGPAILMDLTGIAYCARELTDGFVADGAVLLVSALAKVSDPATHVEELARVVRWERGDGGWWIHDYLDYQPSKEQVLELREIRAEVGRKGGRASGAARSKLLEMRSKLSSKIEANTEAKSNPASRIPESRIPVSSDPEERLARAHMEAADTCEWHDRREELKVCGQHFTEDEIDRAFEIVRGRGDGIKPFAYLLKVCEDVRRKNKVGSNGSPPTGYTDQINQRVIAKARAEGRLK